MIQYFPLVFIFRFFQLKISRICSIWKRNLLTFDQIQHNHNSPGTSDPLSHFIHLESISPQNKFLICAPLPPNVTSLHFFGLLPLNIENITIQAA